ncbi:MAG: response regulator [Firmicutes bacterium]|jgi:response regulator RpfG family c-di-GMP phosphodiesterase|nr:response regulator [Bacillota bacterium]NBI61687.1 response regulator [Clostridiales bacterium]
MINREEHKQTILIVDDSMMNRSILADILEDYEILEGSNGEEGIEMLEKYGEKIDMVLLDIVMPVMDGFEVLGTMNRHHWIENIPVIMISAEDDPTLVAKAYELGVTDYISRPFDSLVVRRRVVNALTLYEKQKKLIDMVVEQIHEKEESNGVMVMVLSHIVEFRNGESGLHVIHIKLMTELLLECLMRKTDQYKLTHSDIQLISTASALHDIGKISIPEEVINKPGRLTNDEFEIMKTHSAIGAAMLKDLLEHHNEPLIKVAYEICRWHHERYNGRGYPDGLEGEEIPISAQVVSLADVYDALTSERVYKKAFSHEKAVDMILNGECGVFNPLLLECLLEVQDQLKKGMGDSAMGHSSDQQDVRNMVQNLLHQ